MNIHGASRAGRRRHKAYRLWTGGGPQQAGRGHIVSPCAQLVINTVPLIPLLSLQCFDLVGQQEGPLTCREPLLQQPTKVLLWITQPKLEFLKLIYLVTLCTS